MQEILRTWGLDRSESARRPDPLWLVEEGLFFELGFAEVFEEVEAGAEWGSGKLVDEKGRVGNDDELGVCGCSEDEAGERGEEFGVEAGLGLVEDEEFGRTRCEERGD